jgi:putative transposase
MARPLRGTIYPGLYHVWRRSAGPIEMFRDDFDRTDFCNRLTRTIERHEWSCHSFCLMSTHYHLLVEVVQDALQPGMHLLNGQYAQQFNRRWSRMGHLRGSPYGARRIEGETELLRCVRYIALNPVEAGMCADPSNWLWSSYPGTAGYGPGFSFVTNELVLGTLHEDVTRAQRLLRLLVEPPTTGVTPLSDPPRPEPPAARRCRAA